MNRFSLGEIVCNVTHGGTPPTDNAAFWVGDIPWITGADILKQRVGEIRRYTNEKTVKSTSTNIVSQGDLLVVTRTGVGKMAVAPFDVAISQDFTGLTIDDCVADTNYLYYVLQSKTDELLIFNQGTSINGVTRTDLLNLEVDLPHRTEQTTIADILATVDRAIEQTEALIAKQQRIKAGLLHDLLTRGIDEHGQLRDPSTHRFKHSPVGLVPEEWEVGTIDDLAQNLDSYRVPLKQSDREKRHGDYPYYGASGIIDWIDGYLFDGEFVLLGEDGENVVSRNLPLAFRASGKIWVNNHAHVLEPLAGTDIRFLEELLEHTNYDDIVAGSAQPKITQTGLTRLRFPLPPGHEQRRIGELLSGQKQSIQGHLNSVGKLHRLKTGLMQDLLSGRVSVAGLIEGLSETGESVSR